MRRRQSPLNAAFRNPTVIGALAVLITILAVFLAYNANNGLPFVQSYRLTAQVPNAAALVPGNEVRIGGVRVGVVESITPVAEDDGTYAAQLALKLDKSVEPLPVDSSVIIRSRSALGLKYLQITRGTSDKGYAAGSVLPLSAAHPEPVEFDQFLSTFDKPTAENIQDNLTEFGNALAGRGLDINRALEAFNPLLTNLGPVANNLAAPQTKLVRFFQALDRAANETAPVAQTQADLFKNFEVTFGAINRVRGDYQQAIQNAPASEQAAIDNLPVQRPFLANSAALFHELRPGVRALRTAAPDLAAAFEAGTGSLRRSVAFNKRLKPTFEALQSFAEDPLVALGVHDLTNLATILKPTIVHLTPAQTKCNYLSLWFRNVASLLSEGDNNGTNQRFIIVAAPAGPNNEGGPASAPANGPDGNYLHSNYLPNSPGGGRPNECEAGNEPWLKGKQVIGNVPGNQSTRHDVTSRDTAK